MTVKGQTADTRTQELTGSDGKTVARVTTEQDTSGALKNNFDLNEIQTGFQITQAFVQQVGTFLDNRAKEADAKATQAKEAEQKADDPNNGLSDEQRQALRDQSIALQKEAQTLTDDWGAGGTYRQILTALTAGASGSVTGGTSQFMQNMVVNYVQQQGAGYIGKLVEEGKLIEGSPEHAALHAIIACAGTAASRQDCGSGAAGAAASSLLTGLFSETSPDETQAERQAKANLIETLVTGLAASTGTNTTPAANAATASVDNNWLATQQIIQMNKEMAAAKTTLDKLKVAGKWAYVNFRQDSLTKTGMMKGLLDSGWSDLKGLGQFLQHPIEGLNGIKQLLTDAEARGQLTQEAKAELNAKIDRIETALTVGGDQNAEQLGQDLGNLIWQAGTVATGVGGAAKAGVKLAEVGISVGSKGLETLSGLAKFDSLLAQGGLFASDGKPLMDFSKLTNAQKSVIGDTLGAGKIEALIPGAEKIGRVPSLGQTGIDDLYKVDKPGVDYVVVEYKFGSSKVKPTIDGLQMSDGWLTGVSTNYNRIVESVGRTEALNVRSAMDAGRVEKWLVHTDPFGNVTVGVLDKNGKLIPNPEATSKILAGAK